MIYYIIHGTIYQAPYLDVVIGNRLKTAIYFLEKAINKTVETSLFHPIQGYTWKSDQPLIEKSRKDIADMAKNNKLTVKKLTIDSQRREVEFNNSISKAIQEVFLSKPAEARTQTEASMNTDTKTIIPLEVETPSTSSKKRALYDDQPSKRAKNK